jgi:dolichol kinase
VSLADAWYWFGLVFEYSFAFFSIGAAVFLFLAVMKEKRARLYGWIGGGCAIWMILSFILGTIGNAQFGVPARGFMGTFQFALSIILIIIGVFLLFFAFDTKKNVNEKEAFFSTLLLAGFILGIGIYIFIPSAAIFFGPQDITTIEALLPYYTLTYPFPMARITITVIPLVIFVVGAYVIKEMRVKKYETNAMQEVDKYQKTVSNLDLEISRKIYHVLILVIIVMYISVGRTILENIYNFSVYGLPQQPGMPDPINIWNEIVLPYILDFRAGHLIFLLAVSWIFFILLFTDIVRVKKYRYYPIKMLAKIYRDKERVVLAPHVYLTGGILFAVILSDGFNGLLGIPGVGLGISAQIVMITIMVSALADAVATIIGVTKGKHHLKGGKGKKTWEGWIAGLVSAILLGFLSFLILMPYCGGTITEAIVFSLVGAAIFALIDFFSPPIPFSDNLLNPIAISLALWGAWFLFFF